MSVYQWSTTAGSNASADSNINWSEGQLPSTVNDSARAMMAALAALVRDQGGYATLGGSGNTFTLSLSQAMTSRVPSLIGFFATRSNTGAVTMNVDSLGAAPLRRVTGVDLVPGDIVNGAFYIISWDPTNTEWKIADQAGLLPLTGGTMTGLLTLSGAPTTGLHAATKTYVDTVDARTVSAGTGLTGGGAISTNPTISIASGGVGTTQLANNAVTTVKITDANVTPAKLSQPFTAASAQATTSGTSVNFSGIPSWVKRVSIIVNDVSFSASESLAIQIGPSGGVETSGYLGTNVAASGGSILTFSSEFRTGAFVSATIRGVLTLNNVSGNIWILSGNISVGVSNLFVMAGSKTLAGVLTQVTLKSLGGVNTFTAGSANISYE